MTSEQTEKLPKTPSSQASATEKIPLTGTSSAPSSSRVLRKFESIASFVTAGSQSDSDSIEPKPTESPTPSAEPRRRFFTVRTWPKSLLANGILQRQDSTPLNANRHSADSRSLGSEDTSASNTLNFRSPKGRKLRFQMLKHHSGSSSTLQNLGTARSLDSAPRLTALYGDDSGSCGKDEDICEEDSVHEFGGFEEEYENVTLMYAKHEKIPMKDFGSEIRATMDIDHLLNKAVLLLDLQETSLEELFAKIIHEMDIQEPEFTSEQVRNALFTQDAGNQFHILSRTVQSICTTGTTGGSFDYDQTWICALCMLPTVQHRHVAIARLSHPTNLGRTMQDLRFIMIVIAPSRAKGTKTALETARTFATLFADMDMRQRLGPDRWYLFRGLKQDFSRRLVHYHSDFKDGVQGPNTIQKLLSSVVFLYFACLLPSIALGVLNDDNTKGAITVRKAICAQALGGLFFAWFGGQPMIILLTTAPLAIYIKIIYTISKDFKFNFYAMYACTGLWCQFFLAIYASTELSSVMKYATRSTEEIFALFIAVAFVVESFKALGKNFQEYYHSEECDNQTAYRKYAMENLNLSSSENSSGLMETTGGVLSNITAVCNEVVPVCNRENSVLYILLMFGTLWLGLFLYNFRKTPYLTVNKRQFLADTAAAISVLTMTILGSAGFKEIQFEKFHYNQTETLMVLAPIWELPPGGIFACMGLGFCLSFLFFIDQNITSAIVNNQQNKLRKGSATHLDLLVVALLNVFLSLFGLPWMHGSLPHSPLHLRALADVEERVSQGHVHEVITNVRETRLATMIAHCLIGLSAIFLLPSPLRYIPTSVLHGLFLYMAVTSLNGNEMFERVLLLFTEQAAYPPTHYIRRVPQRKVHLFTVCQMLQLILLCGCGFAPYPYVEMIFPIVCFLFLPIRHVLIPRLIDYKYLDALDGKH